MSTESAAPDRITVQMYTRSLVSTASGDGLHGYAGSPPQGCLWIVTLVGDTWELRETRLSLTGAGGRVIRISSQTHDSSLVAEVLRGILQVETSAEVTVKIDANEVKG